MRRRIANGFVKKAIYGARCRGLDISGILREAGLPADFDPDAEGDVDAVVYSRLITVLRDRLQDEFLGFALTPCRPGTFAMMARGMINCSNLEHAIRRGFRFYEIFVPGIGLDLTVQDGRAMIRFTKKEPLKVPDAFMAQMLFVLWHRFSCWLIGEEVLLEEVWYASGARDHPAVAGLLFDCPCRFEKDKWTLIFDGSFLEKPLTRDERDLRNFLKCFPDDLLDTKGFTESLSGRTRNLLQRHFNSGDFDFMALARSLGTTPQTLRRRLREEGRTFQQIKNAVRKEMSMHYLQNSTHSIDKISRMMGFSEPSTFNRAFKKWTGLTPGAYRHKTWDYGVAANQSH